MTTKRQSTSAPRVASAAPWLRNASNAIGENWDHLKSKLPIDYKALSFSK